MDAKLLGELARAEEDLVSAMLTGDGELAAYDFRWTSLLDEISQASTFGDISNTTLAVADDVVARVSTLVECCLSLSSAPPPSYPILNPNTSSPPPLNSTTSFIPEAYSWLLENIANPYPSSEFKASLARRHNSPASAVSSWFTNVRRRMGWTALCRDFFHNCRADAVDAAYRVLVKEDPNHQLGCEVIHAFVVMKVAAEGLYSTSARSALAADLDTVLKDTPAEDDLWAGDRRRGETGKIVCSKKHEEHTRKQPTRMHDISQKDSTTPICYPSPDFSHSSSPVPYLNDSPTEESEDDEDITPSLLAGRKRRLSPSEPTQVASSMATTRPVKRPRFSSSSLNTSLPSPSTSTEESSENDSYNQTSRVPGTRNSANVNSCKRRLSDLRATGMPKYPQASIAGPCIHAVSDPLPFSTLESERSIDEWFKANFDALFALPPPVDVTEPDNSTQWEVELFNNYVIPEDPREAFTPPIQNNQISLSTNLIALEDILRSLESGEFVAPLEITHPPTMASVPDPVSQGLSLLPDLSQSIDWTALLNEDPCGLINDPLFPPPHVNSTLPEIDLSILQLPQAPKPLVALSYLFNRTTDR